MHNMTFLQKLFLPGILGFTSSYFCPVGDESGKYLPQRPPAYAFGLIWPVLYLLTGYSLSITKSNLIKKLFAAQIVLLTMWPVVFSSNCLNNHKAAMFLIALIIATTIAIMALHDRKVGVILLVPLLAWLFVAFMLNWDIMWFH